MTVMQEVSKAEEMSKSHHPFYILLANHKNQIALMASFTLPIPHLKEWQTILALEYENKNWRELYQECQRDTNEIKLNLFDLKRQNRKHLYFNHQENTQGLLEIVFLFG